MIRCEGFKSFTFGAGVDLKVVLERSRQRFGPGGFLHKDMVQEVTEDDVVLEGGFYDYIQEGMGRIVYVASELCLYLEHFCLFRIIK